MRGKRKLTPDIKPGPRRMDASHSTNTEIQFHTNYTQHIQIQIKSLGTKILRHWFNNSPLNQGGPQKNWKFKVHIDIRKLNITDHTVSERNTQNQHEICFMYTVSQIKDTSQEIRQEKTEKQGWESALSLICSSLFSSKSLILKNKSLSSLFQKERCKWYARDSSKLLTKTRDSIEKFIFFVCFRQFFPFLCPSANSSRRYSLICSF